jgi:phospholipid/cholesterol/gamma-HCH transport system substrate-binding protein
MKEDKRNIIVGLFMVFGLAVFGWLVFRFGDLPTLFSRYDAREITICFPEVPGIQENSAVMFLGYSVGKVIEVKPPALLPQLGNPSQVSYQAEVIVAVATEYNIPANIIPKVYRRGLGASFVELSLAEKPSTEPLQDKARLQGVISEASEFISEGTQKKLDSLINSLTELSDNLQSQLVSRPPQQVDSKGADSVQANVTTAVMRLDSVLKNLNIFLADPENQSHFKEALTHFAQGGGELRDVVKKIDNTTDHANQLMGQVSEAAVGIKESSVKITDSFENTATKIQSAADELSSTLRQIKTVARQVSESQGTMGQMLNDPRLYEALTDAGKNLSLALEQWRLLVAQWQEKGVEMKLKK